MRPWCGPGDEDVELARLQARAQPDNADGHQRYETAAAYAREQPRADRVLSFIVSAADPGLTILPTHRIIFGAGRGAPNLVAAWREGVAGGRGPPRIGRVERPAAPRPGRPPRPLAVPPRPRCPLVLDNRGAP